MDPDFYTIKAKLISLYVVLNFFAILVVSLRFYAIYLIGRKIRLHDYLCIISLIGSLAHAVDTSIGTVSGGVGLHQWQLSPAQITIAYKTFFAAQPFWTISVTSFRLSILLLYREIFSVSQYFDWAVRISVTVVCASFVGMIVIIFTACYPTTFDWHERVVNGYCGEQPILLMVAAASSAAFDIIIVALPLPLVWRLQLRTHKRLAITITFGLGLAISAINFIRLIKSIECDLADFTFCTFDGNLLTGAEMTVGTIVACVPTLGPLLRRPTKLSPEGSKKRLVKTQAGQRSFEALFNPIHPTDSLGVEMANLSYHSIQSDDRSHMHNSPINYSE
ncbi:hypothetical protein GGR51DRAFT_574685 [Nemania sp. FL0031]|nr:hypothetical protein GGR51DRAFT_574685 [Nemania sp. FL0031]